MVLLITSGVRVGTPAVTTRGMGAEAMARIADAFALALDNSDDTGKQEEAKSIVAQLCSGYPLFA